MTLLLERGVVFTGPGGEVFSDGALLIEGARIIDVGTTDVLRARHPSAPRHDARGQLVSAGLINAHMHLYSTFARGMAVPGPPPTCFTEILERLWWRLDRALTLEDLYTSAAIPLCDGLRAGVTTVVDHHASPRCVDGSLARLARAALDVGVRAVLCYETTDRDGPAVSQAGIAENRSFAQFAQTHETLRPLFGLHASFTLEDATLAQIASTRAGVGIHIHVAEDLADQRDAAARSQGRERVIERLHRFGLLDPGALLAHGVHLDDSEVALCARAGATLVHNPQSNANNAVGYGAPTDKPNNSLAVLLFANG